MNLHKEISVTEGQGPVPVKMTLGEIIKDGKCTNPYQIFVLSWLSEFFKDGVKAGSMVIGAPVEFGTAATSSNVINGLKAMSPENQVSLAKYLLTCVEIGESPVVGKTMTPLEWMQYVLQAQR